MVERDWHGLYSESWRDEIVDEAFSHPAKFARALTRRIYQHALEQDWIKAGDTVLDPFGGVGLGARDAIPNGINWMGIELEEKFVKLGQANIALWQFRNRGQQYNDNLPTPGKAVLVQGDSRQLCTILSMSEGLVSSPPYTCDALGHKGGGGPLATSKSRDDYEVAMKRVNAKSEYSPNPSNLGNLPAGDLDLALSSPPYSEAINSKRNIHSEAAAKLVDEKRNFVEYSDNPANLGNLKSGNLDATIGSPPYQTGGHHKHQMDAWNINEGGQGYTPENQGYGDNPANLGNLKPGELSLVSSPPYEGSISGQGTKARKRKAERYARGEFKAKRPDVFSSTSNVGTEAMFGADYGNSEGQIGRESGETFWSAAHTIMQQVYSILKPGAVAIWVLKGFVRDKQYVDFPDQWRQLGEACGFETIELIRAWLIEQKGTQYGLWGEVQEKTIERKSFFRRLAESKGSPRIDFEIILVQQKPAP